MTPAVDPSTLYWLGIAVIAIPVVAVIAMNLDWVFLIFGLAKRAKSFDDWLAVILVTTFLVVLTGDFVVYLLPLSPDIDSVPLSAAVYIHLVPHALVAFIFAARIVLLSSRRSAVQSKGVWKSPTAKISIRPFVIVGAVDVADCIWRSVNGGLAPWIPSPWPGFWLITATVAALAWFLAAIAVRLSVTLAEQVP